MLRMQEVGTGKAKGSWNWSVRLCLFCSFFSIYLHVASFQGSSIGTYTPSWIDEFYCSARGASPETWLEEGRTRRSKRLEGLFAQEGWRPWKSIKVLVRLRMSVS